MYTYTDLRQHLQHQKMQIRNRALTAIWMLPTSQNTAESIIGRDIQRQEESMKKGHVKAKGRSRCLI